MKCPYCNGEMKIGELYAIGTPCIYFVDDMVTGVGRLTYMGMKKKKGVLKLEGPYVNHLLPHQNYPRITAYRCNFCKKIIIEQ